MNARLAIAIFAAAFGSAFQHGYNTGVLNAPQALIMAWIQDCGNETELANAAAESNNCAMSDVQVTLIWAWIVAIFCVGGMIGGTAVGLVAGRVGR